MGVHWEPTLLWLILLVALVLIEMFTMGLTTIWFAGGSLAAFLLSFTKAGAAAQLILFLIVSFVLLLLIRPLAKSRFNGARVRTNAESLIGETGLVMEPVDNVRAQGRVEVQGQEWAARTVRNGELLQTGDRVKVISISGVKLMVEKEPDPRQEAQN